ncbi:hypothetical protein E2C01_039369 [Portunus trituberculatus]|uniref:Uncharacterized protein n=1 Tax=Portunus trituberculatus TaxID=210409 RepID=A0A5B7FGN5_PORTR|nr:hypothetical protein [Portunus trituberculatus]
MVLALASDDGHSLQEPWRVYADHDLALHIFPTCPGWCSFTGYPWEGGAAPLHFSGFRSFVSLMDCEQEFSPSGGKRVLRDRVRPEIVKKDHNKYIRETHQTGGGPPPPPPKPADEVTLVVQLILNNRLPIPDNIFDSEFVEARVLARLNSTSLECGELKELIFYELFNMFKIKTKKNRSACMAFSGSANTTSHSSHSASIAV